MLHHQLAPDFVFGLDLLLQVGDSLLLGGMVEPGFMLKQSLHARRTPSASGKEDRRPAASKSATRTDGNPGSVEFSEAETAEILGVHASQIPQHPDRDSFAKFE